MKADMSTALIVHGYSIAHTDREYVMRGAESLMGRIPTALWLVQRRRPGLIIWNTGASETVEGVLEADYWLEIALSRVGELYKQFPQYFESFEVEEMIKFVAEQSVTETVSKRTSEALVEALPLLGHKDSTSPIREVLHVSSANHASRVSRDVSDIWRERNGYKIPFGVYPAHTSYSGGTAGEVQIVELVPEKRVTHNVERLAGLRK